MHDLFCWRPLWLLLFFQFLAQILLSWLSAEGPGAKESALRAGRTWGAFLADRPAPFRAVTAKAGTARLTG
jgi:hypothetical protein